MRVCFDVYGANEKELYDQAKRMLETFSEGRRWNIDMEAHEEERATDGRVLVWRGEVMAEHEDLET